MWRVQGAAKLLAAELHWEDDYVAYDLGCT